MTDMQVPYRKPGKYTHLKPDPNLTLSKYLELQEKLARMKNSLPAAAAEVKRLAEMGDFSENMAYGLAKGRLRGLNQRILDLEDHLKRAVIIEASKNKDVVELGGYVTVEVNGKQKKFQILGSTETDPSSGIISHNSPIGSALLGRRVGDDAIVSLTDREVKYRIIKIGI